MQRFFRSSEAVYESVRLSLDEAWGNGPGRPLYSCVRQASEAPRDSQGRVLLAVWDHFCQYEAVAAVLPQLLASGAVEEIDEATYRASLPVSPPLA